MNEAEIRRLSPLGVADLAARQRAGRFTPASDAMLALDLIIALARRLAELTEEVEAQRGQS